MNHHESQPIVIVGAGLGGTSAAAFLAHAGVPSVVLDRRIAPSQRPRARMVSARTLEILRPLGIADQVISLGEPGGYEIHVVDTLAHAPLTQREPDETAAVSPLGAALCDQDLLEGVLRDYATTHGSQFRWGHSVTGLDDDGNDGVVVHVEDEDDLSTRFVLLAEGAGAGLRSALGLDAMSVAEPEEFFECLFRSRALDELMADRPGAGFVCKATPSGGVLRRDDHRWTITRYAQPLEDPIADIAAAVGLPVDVEILSEGSWRPSAQLATRFRSGNVFVIGDAAHSMPPSVGMAGNLAIADAHNLAWKLAYVLRGDAGPGLLDSYEPERRAAARVVLDEALQSTFEDPDVALPVPVMQLGIGYPPAFSSALRSADYEQPIVDPAVTTPRIGARLPHWWLSDGRSSLDLSAGTEFVTIDDPGSDLGDGNEPAGHAVWLVRPDGHVAARVRVSEVEAALDRLLDRR